MKGPPEDQVYEDSLSRAVNLNKKLFEGFQLDWEKCWHVYEAAVADLGDSPSLVQWLAAMAGFRVVCYVEILKPCNVKTAAPILSDEGKKLLRESIPVLHELASTLVPAARAVLASSLAFVPLFEWAKQHLWEKGNRKFRNDNQASYETRLITPSTDKHY